MPLGQKIGLPWRSGRIDAPRLALSTVALACVLATMHPVFVDPLAVTASDHTRAPAASIEHPASPAPAWSSSDAPGPADVLVEPVGNAVPLGRVGMSLIVAGSVLLLALLAGIVPPDRRQERQKKRPRDTRPLMGGERKSIGSAMVSRFRSRRQLAGLPRL
jgi:hypothetical protein